MENISNLTILLEILFNGMVTVFIVLFFVYSIGKLIIYFFDSDSDSDSDSVLKIEDILKKKIKEKTGSDAQIISFKKLD